MKTQIFAILLALLALSMTSPAQLGPGVGGNYGSVLTAGINDDPDDSGILSVALRDSGTSSIKLFWQGQVYAFKAKFDADGNLVRKLRKKGVTDGTELDLICVLNPSNRRIGGVLSDPTANGSSFALNGDLPQPEIIEPGMRVSFIEPDSSDPIKEDGFTIVTVGKSGSRATRFVGNLPDGTPYSAGSVLRGTEYALRAGLYSQSKPGSGGQLLGLGEIDGSDAAPEGRAPRGGVAQLLAAFRWHKKRNLARNTAYPNGIDQRLNVNARGYSRARDLSLVLTGVSGPRNATLNMSNGNLGTRAGTPGPNPLSVGVNVTIFGAKIVGDNPHKVKLAVSPLTARFSGSFRHPDTNEVMKFRGAFSSFSGVTPGAGRGNFLSRGPITRGVPPDPANAMGGSVRIDVN